MFARKPKSPTATREQMLALQPLRLVGDDVTTDSHGGGRLCVPIQPPRLATWLSSRFAGRTKTFELDAIGVYVWQQLDGQTSIEQLIRRLAATYQLDLRQAEASVTAFLKTLMQRGLIGVPGAGAPGRAKERA